jgi:hypothetical protein
MRSLAILAAILALLWASPVAAAPRLCVLDTLLDDIVLTDTLANRTATIGPEDTCGTGPLGSSSRKETVGSFQLLMLDIDYTRATAGDLTITITTGITASTATAGIGFCSTVVNGNCAVSVGGVATITVGASSIHTDLAIGIRGRRVIKIVVAHSAAAAGDIIKLEGFLTD